MKCTLLHFLLPLTLLVNTNASFSSYIQQLGKYFGYDETTDLDSKDLYKKRILYEVSDTDEKFIAEAVKLTGVSMSELDSCQQRVSF